MPRVGEVRQEIQKVAAGHRVLIFSDRDLRGEAVRIFDRTFAITYALEAVAVLVAVMGIAGALIALVIDRRREFGLLRFLGAASGQIRKMILVEAGLLGLVSELGGICTWVFSIANPGFCDQQAIVWLDDTVSLAGYGAAGSIDGGLCGNRCFRALSGARGRAPESAGGDA